MSVTFQQGGLPGVADDLALNLVQYKGGGYTYFCQCPPGPGCARSAPVWRVMRMTDATGDMVFAGTGRFEHVATDLTAAAGLTYTLGV